MSPIEESNMTMKLTYYDEVTPVDYEPSGFLSTPFVQPKLPAGTEGFRIGQVSTLYHGVQLGVQSIASGGQGEDFREIQLRQQDQANQCLDTEIQHPQIQNPEVDIPISSTPASTTVQSRRSPPSSISVSIARQWAAWLAQARPDMDCISERNT